MSEFTLASFMPMLADVVRQRPGWEVFRHYDLLLRGIFLAARQVGGMYGIITVSSDGWLNAHLCSHLRVPVGRRAAMLKILEQENERRFGGTWSVGAGGRVVFQVEGLNLRGSNETCLGSVARRIFRRVEVMDKSVKKMFEGLVALEELEGPIPF